MVITVMRFRREISYEVSLRKTVHVEIKITVTQRLYSYSWIIIVYVFGTISISRGQRKESRVRNSRLKKTNKNIKWITLMFQSLRNFKNYQHSAMLKNKGQFINLNDLSKYLVQIYQLHDTEKDDQNSKKPSLKVYKLI